MPNKKKGGNKKMNKNKVQKVSTSKAKNASFGGSGVIDAPLALDMSRPVVSQRFLKPSHKGSEGRVTGVDFVGTYTSLAASYSITTFIMNARNTTLFPRLSAIAGVWRRYFPLKIRFHLYGINAATQKGYVAMSSLVTDDLATQTVPSTEAQILNQENIAVGRPWSYTCHTVNLGGMGLSWYTTDTTASGTEFGEAVGSAFLGIPQTVADGDISIQIYVEYDIEFCQRITASLVPAPFNLVGGRFYQTNFTPAAGNLLVGGSADNSNQNLVLDPVAGTITLTQPGTYLVSALVTGTTLVGPMALTGAGLIASVTNTGSTNILATWIVTGVSGGTTLGPLSITSYALLSNIQVRIGYAPDSSLSVTEEDTYPRIRVIDDKLSWRKSFPSSYSLTKH